MYSDVLGFVMLYLLKHKILIIFLLKSLLIWMSIPFFKKNKTFSKIVNTQSVYNAEHYGDYKDIPHMRKYFMVNKRLF